MNEVYKKPETEDEKLESRLVSKMDENAWTAEELREAYYLLCGVSDSSTDERVLEIKSLMEEMTEKRYPLNRFVKIISGLEEWEDSGIHFTSFVDDLEITQKEKDMLKSIVDQNRAGELVCMVDGNAVAKFRISENVTSNSAAYALRVKLSEILTSLPSGDGKKSRC